MPCLFCHLAPPARCLACGGCGTLTCWLVDTFSHTAVGAADSFRHDGAGSVNDPALFSMTNQAIDTLIAGSARAPLDL